MQNRAAAELSDPRRRWCWPLVAGVAGEPVLGAEPSADRGPDVVAEEGDWELLSAVSGACEVCPQVVAMLTWVPTNELLRASELGRSLGWEVRTGRSQVRVRSCRSRRSYLPVPPVPLVPVPTWSSMQVDWPKSVRSRNLSLPPNP